MDTVKLGRAGLRVSRLCLGTMNFCPGFIEESIAFATMDRALAAGINFFDTANVYGDYYDPKGVGQVEAIVGRWLTQDRNRRDRIVLATKVFGRMGEDPNQAGLSAYHIRQACEASLKRLQTDHIDLFQMHHIDRTTPWGEIWQAMEQLVREGKVIYVGSSNFAGWHLAQAQGAAAIRNFMGLVSEQSLYNLLDRTVELEVLPACQAYGLGFLCWSPLKSGMLAGTLQREREGRHGEGRRPLEPWMEAAIEEHREQLQAYETLCRELGEKPANVALAWLLHNPIVTAPIIGPRTVAHLESSLRALEIKLSGEVMARLDEIWPGPGGPAPEAYAW